MELCHSGDDTSAHDTDQFYHAVTFSMLLDPQAPGEYYSEIV